MARQSIVNKLNEPLELVENSEVKVTYVKTWAPTFDGKPRNVHSVLLEGQPRDIYGSKMLDDTLSALKSGTVVYITYLGKKKLEGGNSFKEYAIEIDA